MKGWREPTGSRGVARASPRVCILAIHDHDDHVFKGSMLIYVQVLYYLMQAQVPVAKLSACVYLSGRDATSL